MITEKLITGCKFATEDDAWRHFDEIVDANGAFANYHEQVGEYLQPRWGTPDKTARVDRLLIPKPKAVAAGWVHGAIAIEGKKSGSKVGPLVTQAMDYTRCVFRCDRGPVGLLVLPTWVFVWPWIDEDVPRSAIESVMSNNRIGYITPRQNRLVFSVSATHAIQLGADGFIEVHALPMGNKRGSR